MNDLAEKALHVLTAGRDAVGRRPVIALSIGGFLAGAAIVVIGGRIGAAESAVPLNHWLGLLPDAGYTVTGTGLGVAMLGAIGILCGLWVLTVRAAWVRRLRAREAWLIAAVWALPFAVGPPMLTTDIYRHVAEGMLARRGHSPYHHGADKLGTTRLVAAIDPDWRSAHSTDGPLGSLISHLAVTVSGGSVLGAVLVLRAVAIVSVVVVGRLAVDLAGTRRAEALCLTVLNPAVLLYVISAGEYAGVVAALLLAALLGAARRRWSRAVIWACLAAGVKPVILLAVPPIIAVHALSHPARWKLRVAVRDTLVALATLTLVALTVPFGLGWAANLGSATHAHTPFAPAAVVGNLVGLIVPSASYDDLAIGGRIAAGVAGVTVIGYLYATVLTRPLERTIGFALLAAGLLAPVLYPSYLLWGVLCLAPTAVGARRDWMVALSCAACVLTPVGLGASGATYATVVALTVIGAVLLARLVTRHRAGLVASGRVSAAG